MNFIVLNSPELDMKKIDETIGQGNDIYIAETIDELLEKIKVSIDTVNYYKALFIYPGNKSKEAFQVIKDIRKMEQGLESHIHIVIFVDTEKGVRLLEKFSMPTETFIHKTIIKRKLIEVIDKLG